MLDKYLYGGEGGKEREKKRKERREEGRKGGWEREEGREEKGEKRREGASPIKMGSLKIELVNFLSLKSLSINVLILK